jgi:hypothetical protein
MSRGMNVRGEDRLDPVVVEESFPSFAIGNEDELHWPFGGGEDSGYPVHLFMCRDKTHVFRRDLD